jgi:YD repeat-containing protein
MLEFKPLSYSQPKHHMRVISSLIFVSMTFSHQGDAQSTESYGYDARGRLISKTVEGPQNSSTSYLFDKADNRTQVNVSTGQSIILNRSFEYPQVSDFQYRPDTSSAQGMLFAQQAGVARNGGAWGFPAPWQGDQVAFLQAGGSSEGSFEMPITGLTIGATYRIAFAAAQRPNYPANAVSVSISGQALWSDVPASAAHFTAYATNSFVASAATMVLKFSATPSSVDSASGIDSVSVQKL